MILTAFTIACGVYIFIHISGILQFIRKIFRIDMREIDDHQRRVRTIRLKPFDCDPCLGFWVGAIVFGIQTQNIWLTISGACISSVFSLLLYLIIRRL